MKKKIVIIGNGMTSYKFCEKLVAKAGAGTYQIEIFGEENRPAYDRVHLSAFFSGKSADDLALSTYAWYEDNDIALHLGDPVLQIDPENRSILSFQGRTATYDYLILATGSAAFVPQIPGIDKEGVFVYRTIEDLEMMAAFAKKAKTGAVIGGGLLGLEAAKALLDLGITQTQIIEFAPRLMPRQIDAAGSKILEAKIASLGLAVLTNKSTTAIVGTNQIEAITFSDNTRIEVDMLVISAGIKPRDELARRSGLAVGERGGIIVNELLQTSNEHIYAIGECALYEDMIYGLIAPGYEMAEVVAANITQNSPVKAFLGFDMSTKLKLIGVDVASFGDPFSGRKDARSVVFEDALKGIYKRINISGDGKQLLGGILIGDAADYNNLLQTCKNNIVLPPNPEDIILGSRGGNKENADSIGLLPDAAIICSCEAVSKAEICNAVLEKGCSTVEDIKKCTKAGTGCSGCVPMIKDLLNYTMELQGMAVQNLLCEHFEYSRQELFDLIKLKSLKGFDEVLQVLGQGDGCEICKPAVSSILASLWNEMILTRGNDTAQDSNDRYLANIQKGGSYSVVPRIPGGEITPDKLIVIGQVAKKFNLYTKITGGQRIDLFGAHINDLPSIWEELIAAGFESGHAYGKALRTVKSCVGSTWCRFGLHDSVSFAIEIEERYRGLRSPHKLKSAVSGCIRECAEARSKDFGIIATERGWNLYVCGNGGSKPQHGLLLAADIDSKTCIRYIDRFLMFYIKTAEPLMRTSPWLNKMEGGIEYLKKVIVHDSLGMALELEASMQTLVDNYRCEWKEVVESPELRKRFTHFINAPAERNPETRFEPLRDQKRAQEWK
ncbi:MAG TPA: nitrite reductase large subunit NirB [Arachidicoccus sp.]|nr:nitrite reductase large subunit NirB [Arachidicoccus sp.]